MSFKRRQLPSFDLKILLAVAIIVACCALAANSHGLIEETLLETHDRERVLLTHATGDSHLNAKSTNKTKTSCDSYYCPCCKKCVKSWRPFGHPPRPVACPFCKTVERHRKVCLYFNRDASLSHDHLVVPVPSASVHIAPVHTEGNLAYFGPHIQHVKLIAKSFPSLSITQFDYFAPGYTYR